MDVLANVPRPVRRRGNPHIDDQTDANGDASDQ